MNGGNQDGYPCGNAALDGSRNNLKVNEKSGQLTGEHAEATTGCLKGKTSVVLLDDVKLHAPVSLSAFGGVVGVDRLVGPVPMRCETISRNPVLNQILLDTCGTRIAKPHVHVMSPTTVRVPLYGDLLDPGICLKQRHHLIEYRETPREDSRASSSELDSLQDLDLG